jgi:hypothetical protein
MQISVANSYPSLSLASLASGQGLDPAKVVSERSRNILRPRLFSALLQHGVT